MADVGFALAQAFVRIRPTATGFRSEATTQIKSALSGVKGEVPLTVDSDLATAKISELRGYLDELTSRAWDIQMAADSKEATLAIQRIFQQLRRLDAKVSNPKITLEGIARAQTQLLALDVALDKIDRTYVAKVEVDSTFARFLQGGWNQKIPLFGGLLPGILGAVGGIHLLTSVVVDFLAVLIPATVALGVFGAVGADSVQHLVQWFQTANTVGRAMHQNLLPLSGDFARLEKSVQPQVYAIFGDALLVAAKKGGILAQLARGTGTVLDQLAARATLALKSNAFSKFVRDAVPDLQKLGDVAGNIFGAIGNILKSLPGVANAVLNVFVALSKAIEFITGSPIVQWFIRLSLAAHGFLIYVGLLSTGLFLLGGPLGRLSALFGGVNATVAEGAGKLATAKAGWQALAQNIGLVGGPAKTAETAVGDVAKVTEDGAGKTGLFAKALGLLGGSFGWTTLAIGAAIGVGILVHWLLSAKDATARWTQSLQDNISRAANFGGVQQATISAVGKTANAYARANTNLNHLANTTKLYYGRFGPINGALSAQQGQVSELAGAHAKFQAELATEDNRLSQLQRMFGSTNIAQGLFNQAGIKSSDIATANQTQWRQDIQTLQGLVASLKATADAAGSAGNNERVLTYELSDQYTAVQKLNQGWDAYVSAVTGTQSAFDTVAQGTQTLSQSIGTITTRLGALRTTTPYVKTNIDALTPSGIALNQAFSQQVGNFNALFDSWRQSGLATRTLNSGIKAAISTLLPFAAHSKEATSQLAALASEAGYNGPVNFRLLQHWIGVNTGGLKTLKQITDEAAFSETQLTGAFQSQGNAIAQHLIGNINTAILAYNGVYKAASLYGKALAEEGSKSSVTRNARQTLINDIIASGKAAHDSTGQIAALIGKVLNIPPKQAIQIVMGATGTYSIYGQYPGGPKGHALQHAAGYRVPGYGGGDRHPALLEGGESVVPKHLTPLVAPLLARHGVPGFASGVINYGNAAVLSGDYARASVNAFSGTAINALLAATRAALYAAERAAVIASQTAGYLGVRVYDSGGFLPAGMSLAYNGTGRPEPVGGAATEVRVELEWVGSDSGLFSAFRQGIRARGGLKKALGP